MNKQIEELRDLNLELESLKARKEAIKQKIREHRDSVTDAEIVEHTKEAKEIRQKIEEVENKIKKVQSGTQKNRGEDIIMKNSILHFNDEMTREEARETVEYRSAFLKRLQGRELTEEEKRSLTSGTSSVGAAIPTSTMDMIIGQLTEKSTLLNDVTVLNIPDLLSIPKENVTNDASWVAEDADSSNSDDTLTNIALSAYKLIRTIKITAKVSAMTVDAFETWIVSTMTKKMTKAIENAIINGTGTNQPTGIETGTTWVKTGDNPNAIELAKGSTFGYDNFVDAEALVEEDYLANAVYYMNRKTLSAVRKIKDDNKRPLFERAIEDGFRGSLNGIPVKLSKHIKDNTIYLGDLKSGYILNFTAPIEFATSKEAGFMSGATVYRSMALLDGKPTGVTNAIVKLSIATAASGT